MAARKKLRMRTAGFSDEESTTGSKPARYQLTFHSRKAKVRATIAVDIDFEEEIQGNDQHMTQMHENFIEIMTNLAENLLRDNLAREAAQQVTIAAARAAAAEKHQDDMALVADRLKVLQLEEKLQKNRRAEIDMETLRESFSQLESNPDILDRKMKILEIQLRKMDSDNKSKELEIELLRLNNLWYA